jgi:hypothetical protein
MTVINQRDDDSRSSLVGMPALVGMPTHDAAPSTHDHIAIYKRIGMAVPLTHQDSNRTFSGDAGSRAGRRPAQIFFVLFWELLQSGR